MTIFTSLLGKKRVRVHLRGEAPSLEGILVSNSRRHLHLIGTTVWTGPDESHTADGTVTIPRENVAFWQVLEN